MHVFICFKLALYLKRLHSYFTDGKTQGYKLDCQSLIKTCQNGQVLTKDAPLNEDITDFLVKGPYMFATQHNKVHVTYMLCEPSITSYGLIKVHKKFLWAYKREGGLICRKQLGLKAQYTGSTVGPLESKCFVPSMPHYHNHSQSITSVLAGKNTELAIRNQ